jgi:hypothetical protein
VGEYDSPQGIAMADDDKPPEPTGDEMLDGLRAMQYIARWLPKPMATGTIHNPTDFHPPPKVGSVEFTAPGPGEPGYSQDVRRDIASAIKQSERKMFLPSLRGWTIFGLVRFFVTVLVGTAVVFILTVLFESNVRHFFEAHDWDTLLTRTLAATPEYLMHYTTWLIIGLIFGAAAAIWLIWAFPHRLGDHGQQSNGVKWGVAAVVLLIGAGAFYAASDQPSPKVVPQVQSEPVIGAERTLGIMSQLRERINEPLVRMPKPQFVIVTASPEQHDLQQLLSKIIAQAEPQIGVHTPDLSREFDALKLFPTPDVNGIVLYGTSPFKGAIEIAFQQCFFMKVDKSLPEGAGSYFGVGNDPSRVTWFAIGKKSPWKDPHGCR